MFVSALRKTTHVQEACWYVSDLDPPKHLKTVDETAESITLEWINSKANVPSYRIKYGPLSGGEHGELVLPSGPQGTTQAKITGERWHNHFSHEITDHINNKQIAEIKTYAW